MTTKAEKLARELIALSERYSERDFDRATELLLSGELFAKAVRTARQTREATKAAKRRLAARNRLTAKPADASEVPVQLDLDDLLQGLGEGDREQLALFAKRFQNREVLENGSATRMFAERLGLELPKSLPARPALLKVLLRELRLFPEDVRSGLLKEADRLGNSESSLQRWSDLIVRRDAS